MKSLIENVVSFFKPSGGRDLLPQNENWADEIVSDYIDPGNSETRAAFLPGALKRKQAGIFYADVADYARLTEQDEEGTHQRLVEAIKIMMTHVAANNGRIAHLAGDAILAEFRDSDSALHCAINVQLAARQWNTGFDAERHVLFRIGVNFGDVIADHGDIYGNAVNLAARLEKLASSGGVCVSESVMKELRDHSSYRFVALGKQYVKNIREPVQAFRIEIDSQQLVEPGLTTAVKVSAVAT